MPIRRNGLGGSFLLLLSINALFNGKFLQLRSRKNGIPTDRPVARMTSGFGAKKSNFTRIKMLFNCVVSCSRPSVDRKRCSERGKQKKNLNKANETQNNALLVQTNNKIESDKMPSSMAKEYGHRIGRYN